MAVAGCLFEVHLDRTAGAEHWRWIEPGADGAVTLITAHLPREPEDRCHLRFRAEREGEATLRFAAGEEAEAVLVRIAPESQ